VLLEFVIYPRMKNVTLRTAENLKMRTLAMSKAGRLMKIALFVPIFIFFTFGIILLAAEPLCLQCFSRQVYCTDVKFPGPEVNEYTCSNCHHSWKPLNLHHESREGCLVVYR
jgi:hypothetical protein